MTLASKEHLLHAPSPGDPSAPFNPSVAVNMGLHGPAPTPAVLYPVQDIHSVTLAGQDGQVEGNQPIQDDLTRLNELKDLSKKIEKDLEAIKKQGKELEQKFRQKETPPMFCFFLSLRTGALIIGLVSMAIYSFSLLGFSTMINERFDIPSKNGYSSYNQRISSVDGVMLMTVLCVLTALFKSNLLLLAVYLNKKSYVRIFMALTVFILNWFLVYFFGAGVGPFNMSIYAETYGIMFIYFSAYEVFALYNVYRYYQTMD